MCKCNPTYRGGNLAVCIYVFTITASANKQNGKYQNLNDFLLEGSVEGDEEELEKEAPHERPFRIICVAI